MSAVHRLNSRSQWVVSSMGLNHVIIRDVGTDSVSVTNDAEDVVSDLHTQGLGSRRLLYFDSEGCLDELCHDGHGNFTGFRAACDDEWEC